MFSSTFISLGTLLKLSPFPLIYFIYKKSSKYTILTFILILLLSFVALMSFGTQSYTNFINFFSTKEKQCLQVGNIPMTFTFPSDVIQDRISFISTVSRLFKFFFGFDLYPFGFILIFVKLLFLCFIIFLCSKLLKKNEILSFSLLLTTIFFLSTIFWPSYFTILSFPVFLLLFTQNLTNKEKLFMIFILIILTLRIYTEFLAFKISNTICQILYLTPPYFYAFIMLYSMIFHLSKKELNIQKI